ncbi:Uncharacterized protein TCM_032920 [Theobroma cacao]|uniref:Uncharacterized protein n=1 Tax=Theobroma cacao TaxID=3641 RepID=A0A061FAB1_THECC|nr:Uncharacterized protein TCM_032920 [Theobroma cacao]
MWFMYYIKRKHKILLSKFVFSYMMKIMRSASKSLLYNMIVIEIIDFHALNTRVDPPKAHSMHTKIDSHIINKFGYECKDGV